MVGLTWRGGPPTADVRVRTRRHGEWTGVAVAAAAPRPARTGASRACAGLRATEPLWTGDCDAIDVRGARRHPGADPVPDRARPGPGPARPGAIASSRASRPSRRAEKAPKPRHRPAPGLGCQREVAQRRAVVQPHHPAGARAPHGQQQRLRAGGRPGAAARHLPLPHQEPRLVRRRLQLPRRPLRRDLAGPRRRLGARRSAARTPSASTAPPTGIAVIGNFEEVAPERRGHLRHRPAGGLEARQVRPQARPAAPAVYSQGSDKFAAGQKVRLPVIDGHRDTNDTACPGAPPVRQRCRGSASGPRSASTVRPTEAASGEPPPRLPPAAATAPPRRRSTPDRVADRLGRPGALADLLGPLPDLASRTGPRGRRPCAPCRSPRARATSAPVRSSGWRPGPGGGERPADLLPRGSVDARASGCGEQPEHPATRAARGRRARPAGRPAS